jgi:hypothetical protein
MSNIASGITLTTALVQSGDTTGNLVFQTNGTTTALTLDTTQTANFVGNVNAANNISATGNITGGNITGGNITITSALSVGGNIISHAILETANIVAAAPASTTNFDIITAAIQYYTSNANVNFTLNFRGNSTTTANNLLATGQSTTTALLVTNGASAYYPTVIQVDGSNVTPKWQGGTAPTSGDASALDIYSFTLIKTAANTYTVLGSQTKFA